MFGAHQFVAVVEVVNLAPGSAHRVAAPGPCTVLLVRRVVFHRESTAGPADAERPAVPGAIPRAAGAEPAR